MYKYPNAKKIKAARSYSIPEVAEVLGCSARTVRNWAGMGLRVLSDHRPFLIVGDDLKTFLADQSKSKKVKLGPNELFCLSCKAPRQPMGMMADEVTQSATISRLVGLCEVCGGTCNRMISAHALPEFARIFDIASK
ncbi:helix-turn-helix domain-containing protein [Thioclava sp. 15-R06ZXC-3]|uniref:Helix-turn-helix domain-containing protein n=1 Tax=Thioclava arctica TaxID=3238301 RepID=A0ABV3TNR8_9RHOB